MSFNLRDLVAFLSFVAVVIGASPYAGRKEENPDGYSSQEEAFPGG